MTLDEITGALKSSDATPKAALQAGTAHADDLAPLVYDLCEKLCRGVYLLPEENELLFHGLHILAAAGHKDLCSQVLEIARLSEHELNRLFPEYASTSLTRLLLSVWDADGEALTALIANPGYGHEAKWAFFDILARLTFDGRIDRGFTISFLERFEAEGRAGDDDMTWWAWEEAVTKLGVKELEPAQKRVWGKTINDHHSDRDHEESQDELNRAAADLSDPGVFDDANVCAITDPVEALAWVEKRAQMFAKWEAERDVADAPKADKDPAKAIRLSDEERDWLAGFLGSRQAPDTAMSFEMVDGLFTALVIGPETVMPSQYMPVIWDTDDGSGPVWEGMEQAQYFMALLMKHWNAIAARREADALHDPHIVRYSPDERGREWALGFAAGMNMTRDAWEPIFKDQSVDAIIVGILALAYDELDLFEDDMTPENRADLLDALPVSAREIAAYWRRRSRRPLHRAPARSTKVGRNAPCPCGSRKKFKRCCGNAVPATLH